MTFPDAARLTAWRKATVSHGAWDDWVDDLESTCDPDETVAKRLGLTSRSLQRRLKDDGTSFQTLREDVRRELARRYLDDGLAIAEISFLLGFSEPSAFFRAFKRWTGETPLAHKRRAVPA